MSRHSHWAKIKRGKGATDAARSSLFSKLARMIAVAAREGGGDPVFNVKLRLVVDRAKAEGMPKDAIERAIIRGTGAGADAASYESVCYEGFAPGGAAVLVECVTDNRNRTLGEVKAVFREHSATLGGEGSVRWQFERRGVIRIAAESLITLHAPDRSDVELALIEAGAEDIRVEDRELVIPVQVEDIPRVRDAAQVRGLTVTDAGLEWVPMQTVEVPETDRATLTAFLEALDALDDVQDVSTTARGV